MSLQLNRKDGQTCFAPLAVSCWVSSLTGSPAWVFFSCSCQIPVRDVENPVYVSISFRGHTSFRLHHLKAFPLWTPWGKAGTLCKTARIVRLFPHCAVLFCIDEMIIYTKKRALFLVLKRTHYWSLRDFWEGLRKGFVFRIYTPSSCAALNNVTIESCASVGLVSSSFKLHTMPVAKVSQGGCRLGVEFLFQGEKHCRRASEGLAYSLASLILLCSGRRLLP